MRTELKAASVLRFSDYCDLPREEMKGQYLSMNLSQPSSRLPFRAIPGYILNGKKKLVSFSALYLASLLLRF